MGDEAYGLTNLVLDLRAIAAATRDAGSTVAQVRPLALRMAANPTWVRPEHYQCDPEIGIGVHLLSEEPDHTLAVLAVAWLPHRGVEPHNHGTTWAVVAGVDGPERNRFWKRLDDASRDGYAELRQESEKIVGKGDVVSIMPDGIHSVANDTDAVTLSLHVYGMNINHIRRFQFDVENRIVRRHPRSLAT